MYLLSDILHKPVFLSQSDKPIAHIEGWIHDGLKQATGFITAIGGWHGGSQILPWQYINSVTRTKVTVQSIPPIFDLAEIFTFKRLMEESMTILNRKIIAPTGKKLGELASVYLHEDTGKIVGYQITDSTYAIKSQGYTYFPADNNAVLQRNSIIVTHDTQQDFVHRLEAAKNSNPFEDVLGCRAYNSVRTDDGNVVVACGQIVTPEIRASAHQYTLDDSLIAACTVR